MVVVVVVVELAVVVVVVECWKVMEKQQSLVGPDQLQKTQQKLRYQKSSLGTEKQHLP